MGSGRKENAMPAANGTTRVLADTGYVLVRAEVAYCVLVPAGVPENEAVPIARRAVNRVIWLRNEHCRQEGRARWGHTPFTSTTLKPGSSSPS
jgi:hypothetical protein